MTLPTFLGIGAPRAGSSWIAALLRSHPEVYMAPGKEIYFFNKYYDRGLSWYEKRFPAESELHRYQAIGEFTPEYLYCQACPERIAKAPSITKLILSLRNPVDRAYSHYGLQVRSVNYQQPFETYLSETNAVEMGFYSRYLKNYLRHFSREQLLILIFEETIAKDKIKTKQTLAKFLDIAVDGFLPEGGEYGVNSSYIPKWQQGYALYVTVIQALLKFGFHRTVETIRRLRIQRAFGEQGLLPPMKPETRQSLQEIYQDEIRELEMLLQMELLCWEAR